MPSSLTKPPTLKELIIEKIRNAILNGELKSGERIVETKLAEKFEISRGPIREAINHLKSEGLVKVIPYKGTFVVEMDESDLLEIFLIREMIEGLAARKAAEIFTQGDFEYLQKVLDEANECKTDVDLSETSNFSTKFHEYICANCGLPRLYEMWKNIYFQRRFFAIVAFYREKTNTISDHQEVLENIMSGNPDLAERSMREHIQRYYQIFLRENKKRKER